VLVSKKTDNMAVLRYDIRNADGTGFELRYWLPKNIPVLDEQGNISYIIHYVQDVTAQITQHEQEMLTQQNFHEFFNQAKSPFAIVTGKELRMAHVNPAYNALMGNRELEGKTITDAIPELEGQPSY
jgi:PAS domain-containing protein